MILDNPLNCLRAIYQKELEAVNAGPASTSNFMSRIFRWAQILAFIGGAVCIALFLIVIPAVALSFEILTSNEFST